MRKPRHFYHDMHHKRHIKCTGILVLLGVLLCLLFIILIGSTTFLLFIKRKCSKHEDCRTSNPCSQDRCNEISKRCEYETIGGCCIEDSDCGSTSCYNAFCDRKTYVCKVTPTPNGTICDDNNDCTVNDQCYDSICMGNQLTCNTGSTCSSGYCLKGTGCIFTNANDGIECDDNNKCTVGDHCWNGMCASGLQKDCSHYDSICSIGVCDTVTGNCISMDRNNNMACDDGFMCTTNDRCQSGTCTGDENTCWDNNPCTINTCVEGIGCMLQHEDFNMTCIQGCDCDELCPLGYTCVDGTCIQLDTAGSQIRFLDYEIEQCTSGHRMVMDLVIDSNPYQVGNDTRYIYPRATSDFISAGSGPLGFISEVRNLQTILHNGYTRTGFTLTTACQNVTINNCDSIFSMRTYEFFVNVYHCLYAQPTDLTCIDPSIQIAASIALSVSDCTIFNAHQHIPLYGLGVLYHDNNKYIGLSNTILHSGPITVGFESPAYNNSNLMAMTTQFRICRPTDGHYLQDCVIGADSQCTMTGCYNWDPSDSPIAVSYDLINESVTALAKSNTWNIVTCFNEDNYNEPAHIKCQEDKCPNTTNGIVNNFPVMDDGYMFSVAPLSSLMGEVNQWVFDIKFQLYYCGNATRLRSGGEYHSIVSIKI